MKKFISLYLKSCNQFLRLTLWVLFYWIAALATAHANPMQINMTTPQTLRFGVLPDSSPKMIKRRFYPLLRYLEHETGLRIELTIPKNYRDLVHQFQAKKIDMAFFGGYTFVMTQNETKAVPLVLRDIDLKFSTVFLTRPDNLKRTIEDFEGTRLSFGDPLSTSGHIMPRAFLQERNIYPEKFFSEIRYSGGHDTTVYWVRDGLVDIGAVNSDIMRNMIKDGRLSENDVRILWETPTFTNYVFAIQPDFNQKLRTRLLDSFLALTPRVPTHKQILSSLGASSFLPASNEDFKILHQALRIINQKNRE
jgi:phosphonate transport system substrate-binding protein